MTSQPQFSGWHNKLYTGVRASTVHTLVASIAPWRGDVFLSAGGSEQVSIRTTATPYTEWAQHLSSAQRQGIDQMPFRRDNAISDGLMSVIQLPRGVALLPGASIEVSLVPAQHVPMWGLARRGLSSAIEPAVFALDEKYTVRAANPDVFGASAATIEQLLDEYLDDLDTATRPPTAQPTTVDNSSGGPPQPAPVAAPPKPDDYFEALVDRCVLV